RPARWQNCIPRQLSCIPLCREESSWNLYSDWQLGSLIMVSTVLVSIVLRVIYFFATHHDSTLARRPNCTIRILISLVKEGVLHRSWTMESSRYRALQVRGRRIRAREWPANFCEPAKRSA